MKVIFACYYRSQTQTVVGNIISPKLRFYPSTTVQKGNDLASYEDYKRSICSKRRAILSCDVGDMGELPVVLMTTGTLCLRGPCQKLAEEMVQAPLAGLPQGLQP